MLDAVCLLDTTGKEQNEMAAIIKISLGDIIVIDPGLERLQESDKLHVAIEFSILEIQISEHIKTTGTR